MVPRANGYGKLVVGLAVGLALGGCDFYFGLGEPGGDLDPRPGDLGDLAGMPDGGGNDAQDASQDGSIVVDLAADDASTEDMILIGSFMPDLLTFDLNADALPSGVVESNCHGCAWRGGRAFCWGANNFGELGDGTRTSRPSAAPVANLGGIVQMTANCVSPGFDGHTCALTAYHDVWCWGSNHDGEIGDQTGLDQLTPVKVGTLPAMAGVSVGPRHSCALAADGRVFCWGNNSALTIGDGTIDQRPAPTLARGLTDAVALSAGYAHNCVRRVTGEVACWGANPYGECGTGDTMGVGRPLTIAGIDDALSVTAGENHTCIIRSDGNAWCFGGGQYGNLGIGSSPMKQLTPARVLLSFTPVEIAGVFGQCARDANGAVACWGPAVDPVNGSTDINSTPVLVTPLSDALSLGGSCATRPNGLVSCWGFNANGQVGDGTMMDRASPVAVQGLSW